MAAAGVYFGADQRRRRDAARGEKRLRLLSGSIFGEGSDVGAGRANPGGAKAIKSARRSHVTAVGAADNPGRVKAMNTGWVGHVTATNAAGAEAKSGRAKAMNTAWVGHVTAVNAAGAEAEARLQALQLRRTRGMQIVTRAPMAESQEPRPRAIGCFSSSRVHATTMPAQQQSSPTQSPCRVSQVSLPREVQVPPAADGAAAGAPPSPPRRLSLVAYSDDGSDGDGGDG